MPLRNARWRLPDFIGHNRPEYRIWVCVSSESVLKTRLKIAMPRPSVIPDLGGRHRCSAQRFNPQFNRIVPRMAKSGPM